MPKGVYPHRKWSDERKKKISLIMMGHPNYAEGIIPWNKGKKGLQIGYWKGKKRSAEFCEKQRKAHLCKKLTIEVRMKLSLIKKKNGSGKWMKGRIGKLGNGYKHGLSSDKNYLSWIKNQWNKRYREAEGKYEYSDWVIMKEKYNFTCPMCGRSEPEIKLTIDHIIPLSKNGTNYISNIQPLCRSCNSHKKNRIISFPLQS